MNTIYLNGLRYLMLSLASLSMTACLTLGGSNVTTKVKSGDGPGMNEARQEKYNGPKARIAIIDFEDKTGSNRHWKGSFGRGMKDMLITALFNSDRLIVLERDKMAADERERAKYGRKPMKLEDADILITASITEWEPGSAGGGGAAWLNVIGLGGTYEESHVAIDIRIIDVDTGRILSATTVEGKASSYSAGLLSWLGGTPAAFGSYENTPMEAAIREVINASVEHISTKTPKKYYRYN